MRIALSVSLPVLGALLLAQGASAQTPAPAPAPTSTTAPAIAGVVAVGTTVEFIKAGFTGTEGPLGLPDGHLIFTETQANRITRIDRDSGATSTFLENTNGSNGLGFDPQGRLISVQTTPGATRIGVIYPANAVATLTDSYQGKPYGRPNDLVVSRNGHVYFTEPGPNATPGQPPTTPALPPAVYFLRKGGAAVQVATGIERPNGIMLSPDEKTLYVNNTAGEYMVAFDVAADGSTSNRRNFTKYASVTRNESGQVNSGADGLAVDAEGRIYCAAIGGVQVFSPKGEHLGTIPVSLQPQNIAFAGADKKTLFIVGRGAAFRVRVLTPGFAGRAK
jgi:gluconolactonase